jgi:hypothetical protein
MFTEAFRALAGAEKNWSKKSGGLSAIQMAQPSWIRAAIDGIIARSVSAGCSKHDERTA